MKQILFTLMLSLGSLSLFSQIIDSSYDISKYINPDYSYRSFDVNGNFSGNNQLDRIDRTTGLHKTASASHSINADLNYRYYKNTRKYQTSFNSQFHFNPKYRYNNSSEINKYYTLTNILDLSLDYTIRNYYHNSTFVSIRAKTNNHYYFNKNNNTNYNNNPSKDLHFSNKTSIELTHGHGRIENISNAWRSYLIWEDLSESNLITGNNTINTSDINELADLFASINSTRYFDFREHTKWKFKTIFNQLSPKTQNDINVMVALQDLLGFGNNQYRYSGQRFSYGIKPEIKLDFYDSNDDPREDEERLAIYSTIKYERYKPLSIKWQWDFTTNINFGIYDLKAEEKELTTAVQIKNTLSYFPNTRTSYRTNISLYFNSNLQNNIATYNRYNARWYNNISYYFSPRLRGSFSLSLDYTNIIYSIESSNNDNRNYSISYQTGVNYAIF